MIRIFIPLVLCLGFLSGCAESSRYLRAEPATFLPATSFSIAVGESGEAREAGEVEGEGGTEGEGGEEGEGGQEFASIDVHCIYTRDRPRERRRSTGSKPASPGEGQGIAGKDGPHIETCLYATVDASGLLVEDRKRTGSAQKTLRMAAIDNLLYVADINCSTYLHRVLANSSGMEVSKNILSDIANAASAGTVFTNPNIAAGLNVTNLFVEKTYDQLKASYFFNETFQALESIAEAERAKQRIVILGKKGRMAQADNYDYSMAEIITDIRSYDDACSMRRAVARLVEIADEEKKSQDREALKVQLSSNPAEAALESLNRSLGDAVPQGRAATTTNAANTTNAPDADEAGD